MHHLLTEARSLGVQAVRLVKHSIMQVESMEADLDEEGMFDDLEGVAETVNRFNNRSFGGREDTGHDGDAGASPQPPGSDDDNDDGREQLPAPSLWILRDCGASKSP